MAYVRKLEDGTFEPITLRQWRVEHPNKTLPRKPSEDTLAEYNIFPLDEEAPDEYDAAVEILDEELVEEDGRVKRRRRKRRLNRKERRQRRRENRKKREQGYQDAMRKNVWPVYFEWKLGRATEQEWLDAAELVRQWYADLFEENPVPGDDGPQ